MDLLLLAGTNGSETVDFVEEDDRGLTGFRFVEKEAKLSFCLADPLAEAVGAFSHKEGCANGRCETRCEPGERYAHIF